MRPRGGSIGRKRLLLPARHDRGVHIQRRSAKLRMRHEPTVRHQERRQRRRRNRSLRLPFRTRATRSLVLVTVQPTQKRARRGKRPMNDPSGDDSPATDAKPPESQPRDGAQAGTDPGPLPSDRGRPRNPIPGCSTGRATESSARRSSSGDDQYPQANRETHCFAPPPGATTPRRRRASYPLGSPKTGP